MPNLETPDELADAIADLMGSYDAHDDERCSDTRTSCRTCLVSKMTDRIRKAVFNEHLLRSKEVPRLALYFGPLRGPGHFMHGPNGESEGGLLAQIPWWDLGLLDAGLLNNRKIPDRPDGRVHWVAGGKPDLWFGFFWWDRSEDERPACNSGFYVRGFGPAATAHERVLEAFEYACNVWPVVVDRQLYPLQLVDIKLVPEKGT